MTLKKDQIISTFLPTQYGDFELIAINDSSLLTPTIVLKKGNVENKENVLTRFHSECMTGDIFGSLKCDCGSQLDESLRMISEKGEGIVIYLRQEGRGIGLWNKIRAYKLQHEKGYDTIQANLELGLPIDSRDYSICGSILDFLKVRSIDLITNNPQKIEYAENLDIVVANIVHLDVVLQQHNHNYIITKKDKMGHLFTNA